MFAQKPKAFKFIHPSKHPPMKSLPYIQPVIQSQASLRQGQTLCVWGNRVFDHRFELPDISNSLCLRKQSQKKIQQWLAKLQILRYNYAVFFSYFSIVHTSAKENYMKRGFIFWTAAILGVIALSCSGSDSNSGSSDNGSVWYLQTTWRLNHIIRREGSQTRTSHLPKAFR